MFLSWRFDTLGVLSVLVLGPPSSQPGGRRLMMKVWTVGVPLRADDRWRSGNTESLSWSRCFLSYSWSILFSIALSLHLSYSLSLSPIFLYQSISLYLLSLPLNSSLIWISWFNHHSQFSLFPFTGSSFSTIIHSFPSPLFISNAFFHRCKRTALSSVLVTDCSLSLFVPIPCTLIFSINRS